VVVYRELRGNWGLPLSCGGPEHEHMVGEPKNVGRCRFCGQDIEWGNTAKEKMAPFDPDTKRNHWITCESRKAAREEYPR
jgi:hypothetical protein